MKYLALRPYDTRTTSTRHISVKEPPYDRDGLQKPILAGQTVEMVVGEGEDIW